MTEVPFIWIIAEKVEFINLKSSNCLSSNLIHHNKMKSYCKLYISYKWSCIRVCRQNWLKVPILQNRARQRHVPVTFHKNANCPQSITLQVHNIISTKSPDYLHQTYMRLYERHLLVVKSVHSAASERAPSDQNRRFSDLMEMRAPVTNASFTQHAIKQTLKISRCVTLYIYI